MDELSMNHPVVNISDTSIFLPWMQLRKELYTIADNYVFISIFIPKVFDGIFLFRNALQPKASEYNSSCILFSHSR